MYIHVSTVYIYIYIPKVIIRRKKFKISLKQICRFDIINDTN